ncbi:hypothetical protein VDG1235_1235 [Verrucomicrobiia bacterium DG1235]|nr:hypothetical protein VDG1235_1235 [Verrucomicrobiae bacterium DG1235]
MVKIGNLILCAGLVLFAGCQSTGMDTAEYTRARFVIESTSKDGYSAVVTLPVSQVQVPVEGEAVLSEFDYHAIDLVEVELGKCLVFSLKPQAARAFYQLSVANQSKRLVLVIDGDPIGARRIDGPIADGRIFVFLETTDERLEDLAKQLKETNFDIQKKFSR